MDEVPEALDMAVRLMTPQETSLVSAAARYAFEGRSDRPEVRLTSWLSCWLALSNVALPAAENIQRHP